MSTMLQKADLPPEVDPLRQQEVTIKGPASTESLLRLQADRNPDRSLHLGQLKLMAAVLMTQCEALRDKPLPPLDPKSPHVANERLALVRREASRCAAIAITHLEIAALYMEKAVNHERGENPASPAQGEILG